MKDGRTHLAYKASTCGTSRATWCWPPRFARDGRRQATMVDSVIQAGVNLEAAGSEAEIEEVAADKGYQRGRHFGIGGGDELADVYS